MREQVAAISRRDVINDAQLREQSREFLSLLGTALQRVDGSDIDVPEFEPVRRIRARGPVFAWPRD